MIKIYYIYLERLILNKKIFTFILRSIKIISIQKMHIVVIFINKSNFKVIKNQTFSQSLESYCTSLSSKTLSYKIKKNELIEPINFNSKVEKGDVIAKLSTKTIIGFRLLDNSIP